MRVLVAMMAFAACGHAAVISGHVRDSNGQPVQDVAVELKSSTDTKTTKTDTRGGYEFAGLSAATYTVRLGTGAASEPIKLSGDERRTVDLELKPVDFSNDTDFVVAGVTDNTYIGSHGSDVNVRSTETLSKATDSLKQEPSGPGDADLLRAEVEKSPRDAALHHALAAADEKDGRPLDAVHEYQRAAELDPSEANLFDFAAELLAHGVPQAAASVFDKAGRLFPDSMRMWLGAAVSSDAHGDYAAAATDFFKAIDLNPADPVSYAFLAKVSSPEIISNPGYLKRFRTFVELRPDSALANLYYAAALSGSADTHAERKALLQKAVELDPHLAEAHLRLGVLLAEDDRLSDAIEEYRKAITADPKLEQAHYRLAAVYRKSGENDLAAAETSRFAELTKASAAERDRERSELKRFVLELKH